MGNVCARRTALSNAGGRINYVDRDGSKYKSSREDLLAMHDTAADLLGGQYWQTLAAEAQAAFAKAAPEQRTRTDRFGREISLKAREAHEIMLPLPNGVLDRLTPSQVAQKVAEDFERYTGQPCHVALHWNATRTNLHTHIIYAERKLLEVPEVKVAERNLFFDEEGRRRYKKAEILDEHKQLRPGCSIVKKGEVYEQRCFDSVDQSMGTRSWLKDLKEKWALPLVNGELRGDAELSLFDYSTGKLPLQHVGDVAHVDPDKARVSREAVERDNALVREYNGLVDDGQIRERDALRIQRAVLAAPKSQRGAVLQEQLDKVERKRAALDIPVPIMPTKDPADQDKPTPAAPAQPETPDPSLSFEQIKENVLRVAKMRETLLLQHGLITEKGSKKLAEALEQGKLPVLVIDGGKVRCSLYTDPVEAARRTMATAEPFKELTKRVPEIDHGDRIQPAEQDQTPVQRGGQMSMSDWRAASDAMKEADRVNRSADQTPQRRPKGKDGQEL